MSDSLRNAWQEIETLLDQGINLIPVRDKDSIYKGKLYEAKTPYAEWKVYQYERIDRAVLFDLMANRYDTTAVAMVCGAISGNLEVIDFDTKYKAGIDAVVLTAMAELYPDIIAKLRVHKTRSGGTHLIYRIAEHEVPPSDHLANRPATTEELELQPKAKKYRCFIETRGTGGLATAPPSMGYSIRRNIPIQTITWEERCSIIEFCRAYNEYFPDEKPFTPPKSEANYYDENPFEHYNRTIDPIELLSTYGWTYVRKHGDYVWFTRPGGRKGDVHAGFNTNTCTYRIWGTKADLDAERSYTPSTILAHYAYGDDKSQTYAFLVQQGYGRIKPSMERQIARRKATQGMPMPTNASPAGVEEYTRLLEQQQSAFPHGIFWEEDDQGSIDISRSKFDTVAEGLGFRLHKDEIVQIVDQFIHRRDIRYFFDAMQEYIKHEDHNIYELIYNTYSAFIEKHGKFATTRLPFLQTEHILVDTRSTCYKFYQNGYVLITPQQYELLSYETLTEKLIWYEKIQQRDFSACNISNTKHDINTDEPCARGLYTDFLQRACNLNQHGDHIKRTIGWLAHDYKDASMAYIVVLVEQCADPKDGGGSGKNLFCELLKYTTTYGSTAAGQKKNFDGTTLLQAWRGEKVYALSDVRKDFEFESIKEAAGGKALEKKLFKDEHNLEIEDVPKLIVLTNFSYEVTDGGLRRRIIAIEFTNFFTNCGGVDRHYNKMFPADWGVNDWQDYDNFICESVRIWLAEGLKLRPVELEGTGWEKQFAQTYGQYTFEFIKAHWSKFIELKFICNADFNKMLEEWMIENGLNIQKYKPSSFKMNKALEDWCRSHDYHFDKDAKEGPSNVQQRGKKFYEPAPF